MLPMRHAHMRFQHLMSLGLGQSIASTCLTFQYASPITSWSPLRSDFTTLTLIGFLHMF